MALNVERAKAASFLLGEKKIYLHPVRFELTPSNEDQNLSLAP